MATVCVLTPVQLAGMALAFGATVAGQSPTGTVVFYAGGVPIGSAALSGGTAVLQVNSLPVGSNSLTAVYLGDAFNSTSTSPRWTRLRLARRSVSQPPNSLGRRR